MRIGTRGSPLALAQARLVADRLQIRTGAVCEIVTIRTAGDRDEARPGDVAVKGLFVKEIDDALLAGRVDLAAHSAKDMPAGLVDGVVLAATLPREDPSDALVLPGPPIALSLPEVRALLGPAPRIGTCSLRRAAQLRSVMPEARFEDVRGNVDTRLRHLDAGKFDALALATAGLVRLGLESRVTCRLSHDVCVPSPGQGIIAVAARADADTVRAALAAVSDAQSWACLLAERAVVARLGAGCRLPIGAIATIDGGVLTLRGVVASPNGSRAARAVVAGPVAEATALGTQLADELLASGGSAILEER